MLNRRDFLVATGTAASALLIPSWARPGEARWQLPERRPFRVVENEWIAMSDDTRLAARLWIPEGAEQRPVPVVFEYLPYRKRDDIRARDETTALNLAPYGLAFARVDVRGTGDSEGVMTDEYSEAELADGVECIAWLARQPWSSGAVGMRGISWGGINSLQIAARSPPALKAIMPMGCVDNRYTQDAHYIGGALAAENFKWGTYFKVYMAAPPDPAISGADWERRWRERLDATPAILERWTRHQRFDAYWQRGSVAVDYGRIGCPVYVVAGWLDPYSSSVASLLAGLNVPRKALIGPWGHLMPNLPEPLALDWAHEEVRWWQHWLAGRDTGLMEEPMVRAFLPYRTLAEVYPAALPGRWVAEERWPSRRIATRSLHFGRGLLASSRPAPGALRYVAERTVGASKAQWMPSLAGDQRADDAKSLLFDSPPLERPLEILGTPTARVRVSADVPVAQLALRLNEVLADGSSWLVSYGLLNLTHRDSHEHPSALTPGEWYAVSVALYMVAHRFKRGSRIRLALSESLWPLVWPSPKVATLSIALADSRLQLPVRAAPAHEAAFTIPEVRRAGTSRYLHGESEGLTSVFVSPRKSTLIEATGTTLETAAREELSIKDGDPTSSRWRQENMMGFKRGDWNCSVSASFELTATSGELKLRETLSASKDGEEIFTREQFSAIARDLI